mgnify:CR=1 FL=1
MQFILTDEQTQFRDAVQRFLRDKSPTTEVRRLMETEEGFDRQVWEQMCGDLGLAGIHIPEAYGGLGFGMVELGIVMEEMGQALYCSPYFASAVLAANVILLGADERHRELLLPGIAAGTRIATLAVTEPDGRWDEGGITLTARPAADGFTLDGTKKFVLDGCIANTVIVAARLAAGGIALLLVDGDAEGLTRRSLNTLDDTRKLAELNFSGVQATLLGPPTEASAALARGGDLSTIALANEMVGGAQALLDSAVDYAQMRMQFGRLIGSFQSIKHKCAEMLLDVELAKSAAYYAAEAAAEDDPELPALASLSKALASEVYMATAAECIQIHGGIGFTWDQDTHLWFKRAKSSEVFLGDANFHRERYIQCLEATA